MGSGWYGSVERLLQKIRKATESVKPGAAIYLEYVSSDVNTQYMDGCYSPCVNAGLEMRHRGLNLYVTGTHLWRFYFPDFKFIEIMPENYEGIGLSFFNGNGIHGYLNNPDLRPFVEKLSFLYREYSDAFTSDHPVPYVPTLKKGLYSHAFPGQGRTVYTLYNANDEALEGDMMEVPGSQEARFEELIENRPLNVSPRGDKAALSFRMEPREVLCLVGW
jgi:hypothetical protein